MPIAPLPPEASFVGDGTSRVFPLGFYVEFKSQLRVYVNEVEQTTGWAFADGAVTFATAPDTAAQVRIVRQTLPQQVTEFVRATSYASAGVVMTQYLDADLDRLWMVAQDQARTNTTFADALASHEQMFGAVETSVLNATAAATAATTKAASAAASAAAAAADQTASTAAAAAAVDSATAATTAATTASGHAASASASASAAAGSAAAVADNAATVTAAKTAIDGYMPAVQSASGGHRPFATLSALNSYAGSDKSNFVANVMSDGTTANNGLYRWDGSAWVKAGYDPATLATAAETNAKSYVDAKMDDILDSNVSKNLYNPANNQAEKYISTVNGSIQSATGWTLSGDIAVTAGQQITISAASTRIAGVSFFANNSTTAAISFDTSTANPLTLTVPSGATIMRMTVGSTSNPSISNLQVEVGSSATSYQAYFAPKKTIKDALLPASLATASDLAATNASVAAKATASDLAATNASVAANTAAVSSIVTITPSKNIYNPAVNQTGKFVSTVNGSIQSATGWTCSGYIPVTPGQQITISAESTRQNGVGFFATSSSTAAISFDTSSTNPLTLTVPAGANFMVLNVTSPYVPSITNLQVEVGSSASAYIAYGAVLINPSADFAAKVNAVGSTKGIFTGGASSQTIVGAQGGDTITHKIVAIKAATHEASRVFNWLSTAINNTTLHSCGDDPAPLHALGWTIGANHGYPKSRLTAASHGKTLVDVGAIFTDGTTQFVIVGIVDSNTLDVTARTTFGYVSGSSGSLTHVSGATSTTAISYTANTAGQWYPVLKNHQIKVVADGTVIDPSIATSTSFNQLVITQSYELMSKAAMVEWLITQVGKTTDFTEYSAAASLSLSQSYTFDKYANCVINTDIVALYTTPFADAYMLQSARLTPNVDGNVYYYIPKTIPFSFSGTNWDFASKQDVSTFAPSGYINFTPDRWASSTAIPDRVVQLTNNFGYATGFLPVADATGARRQVLATTKGLSLNSTDAKIYMAGVDSATITSLNAGDYFSFVGYRNYFRRPTERTDNYTVSSKQGDFLYVDWHTATTDRVQLPPEFVGRAFTVVEKSASVSVLSQSATGSVVFKTTGAGYAVLRFV